MEKQTLKIFCHNLITISLFQEHNKKLKCILISKYNFFFVFADIVIQV